jgi:hypothetical protein
MNDRQKLKLQSFDFLLILHKGKLKVYNNSHQVSFIMIICDKMERNHTKKVAKLCIRQLLTVCILAVFKNKHTTLQLACGLYFKSEKITFLYL